MHYFILDGEKSKKFGLYLTGSGAFNAPERAIETLEVPGRNGTLILDQGHYKNVTQAYKAFVHKDFTNKSIAVQAWLLSKTGYCRLEDTYNPDYYRMARFGGPVSWTVRALCAGAETELLFDCKPQRFLKSGENVVILEESGSIRNPTRFPALPLLTIYGSGSGSFSLGETVVEISDIDEYVVIDCDIQDAYKKEINKNSTVSLLEFPQLLPGTSDLTISGGITKIEIMPRWWTL